MLYLSSIQNGNEVRFLRNRIAETRKAQGITQGELAKKTNITRPYLSDIENGKYSPGGVLLLRIARALNVKVEDIFFDDGVNHAEQPTGTAG